MANKKELLEQVDLFSDVPETIEVKTQPIKNKKSKTEKPKAIVMS